MIEEHSHANDGKEIYKAYVVFGGIRWGLI